MLAAVNVTPYGRTNSWRVFGEHHPLLLRGVTLNPFAKSDVRRTHARTLTVLHDILNERKTSALKHQIHVLSSV